jgi:hypothetical protein
MASLLFVSFSMRSLVSCPSLKARLLWEEVSFWFSLTNPPIEMISPVNVLILILLRLYYFEAWMKFRYMFRELSWGLQG